MFNHVSVKNFVKTNPSTIPYCNHTNRNLCHSIHIHPSHRTHLSNPLIPIHIPFSSFFKRTQNTYSHIRQRYAFIYIYILTYIFCHAIFSVPAVTYKLVANNTTLFNIFHTPRPHINAIHLYPIL